MGIIPKKGRSPAQVAQALSTPEKVILKWKSNSDLQALNNILSMSATALIKRHPDESTRLTAVRVIRIIGAKKAFPLLRSVICGLYKDPHYLVRESAINTLIHLKDFSAIPIFIKALDDSDEEVRMAAVQALHAFRHMKDKRIIPALEKKLYGPKRDVAQRIRREVVYTLGWLEDRSVLPILRRARKDSDAAVRRLAGDALNSFVKVLPSGSSK